MSTDLNTPQTHAGEADEQESTGLVARLRRRRQEIGRTDAFEDMDVPGYDGLMFMRVVPLAGGFDEAKKLGKRVERSRDSRKELKAAADTIVRACGGLYVRDGEHIKTLDERPEDDDPLTFAEPGRVAEVLGFPAVENNQPLTPRNCVLRTFNNDLAVMKFYIDVSEWLQDRSGSDDEDFVGESSGSTR